jgi:sarcosine oxidase subunit beta
MSNQVADVVVIGAGVQGLSAAYHLAKLGAAGVVVVEKETIGAGSSGRSASMLMLSRENEPKIRFSQYSYKRYMAFKDEFGVDPGFKKIGFLSVIPISTKSEEEAIKSISLIKHYIEMTRIRQRLGVTTEIMDQEDIKHLVPVVNVEDIILGVFGPDDGVIDPDAIMQAYAKGARARGVSIRQGVKATGIEVNAGKVTGVHTTDGFISTPTVVNAAGAEAIDVGKWVGITLPIMNRKRSIFVTTEVPEIPDNSPMVEDAEVEWYYRKEGPGVLMGMGKEESGEISKEPNLELLPRVVEFALHRVPLLANPQIGIMRGWSGIRPLTKDILPILGPVAGIIGFVNDCGWGGEGIMHSPAGGQIIAEFITEASKPTLELAPFLLSRFTEAQPAPTSSDGE